MKRARRVSLTADKASEYFVGGCCSLLTVADKLSLKASVGAALMSALSMALPDLRIKGIVAAYHKIGGELPTEVGAKVLAATARKPKRRRR